MFTLKNNKPEHYDTDFFESALVEAGVLRFCFGPRGRRPLNPFTDDGTGGGSIPAEQKRRGIRQTASAPRSRPAAARSAGPAKKTAEDDTKAPGAKAEPMVTRVAYEQLHEKLTNTEELLQDVLAEAVED